MSKLYLLKVFLSAIFLSIASASFAQEVVVKGKVTSAENMAGLPGVTVFEAGTTNGTVTSADGSYSIKVSPQSTISFSFIGYESQTIVVGDQTTIDVSLIPDLQTLSEIVVVGYGTQEKRQMTGAVTSVSSKSIENLPLTKIDNALQGRTPGVDLSQTSGDPSAGMKIRVRGSNSINYSNNPLYVLDGVIVGSINVLNVNDIESISVLKDASATAIYGSRGANGVVIITTKRGKANSFDVQLDAFLSIDNAARKVDLLSPAQFAEQTNIRSIAYGGNQIIDDSEIAALRNGGGTDWQDKALKKNVLNKNYNLSVSGGSDKTRFFVSGNFLSRSAIIRTRDYDRYNIRTNITSELTKAIEVGTSISLNREQTEGTLAQMDNVLTFDPTTTYRNDAGDLILNSPRQLGNDNRNELIIADFTKNIRDGRTLFGNAYVNIKFLKNFTWRTTGGTEVFNQTAKTFVPSIVGQTPYINWYDEQNTRFNIINQLTYEWNANDVHSIKLDAVQEYQKLKMENVNTRGASLISESLEEEGLSNAGSIVATQGGWEEKIASYMLRANYSFKSKYNLTLAGRYDGSSNFSPENQWGFFPSVGASWVVSEESFLQTFEAMNYLKIRASYGETGNQNVGNPNALKIGFYRSFPGWGDTNKSGWPEHDFSYPISNGAPQVGLVPTLTRGNPDLSWERNKQFDIGFDAEFLGGRITTAVDYYQKRSDDVILTRQLPSMAGIVSIIDNVGSLENKGFEFSLGVRSSAGKDFGWNVNGNITLNRNKVLDLGSINENGVMVPIKNTTAYSSGHYIGTGGDIASILEVGKPMGQFYGYEFNGIYQSNEVDQTTKYNLKPGDPKYTDRDNNGEINSADKTIIGSANPKFTWGLTGGVTFKNFDLNLVVYGKVGGDIYNLSKGIRQGWFTETNQATDVSILDRWTPTNPSNTISGYTGTSGANQLMSSQYVESGTFTRIKDITLGYTIPSSIISKAMLKKVRIYASLNNFFTISKFKGYDPEIGSNPDPSNPRDIEPGIHAMGLVPLPKSFIMGISASF